jgi:hypothetical protein
LLTSESYEIPARAHKGFLLIAYLSPTHSGPGTFVFRRRPKCQLQSVHETLVHETLSTKLHETLTKLSEVFHGIQPMGVNSPVPAPPNPKRSHGSQHFHLFGLLKNFFWAALNCLPSCNIGPLSSRSETVYAGGYNLQCLHLGVLVTVK